MCPIVPTLQCGLFRSNFSFAISQLLAPSSWLLAQSQIFFASVAKLLIVGAEELLSFDQPIRANPLFKTLEVLVEPGAKPFEIPVPSPKVSHAILPRFWKLAPDICT